MVLLKKIELLLKKYWSWIVLGIANNQFALFCMFIYILAKEIEEQDEK